jgi:hypothetical protein
LLLLALRVVERPDRIRIGVLGLVVGLAFWQTPQIVPVAAPIVAWTIWKEPRALRQLWVGAPAAALGASPWIVWNAVHGWKSLIAGPTLDTYARSLRLFVSPLLPMTLGLRAPFSAQLLLPHALTFVVYAALLAAFAFGAVRARRRNVSLVYAVAAAFPLVYALSPKTADNESFPLYVVVVMPVLVLLVAQLGKTRWRAAAVLAAACAVSIITFHRIDYWAAHHPHSTPSPPQDFRPLIAVLDRLGIRRVYADYWFAYRLAFDTNERVIGTESRLDGVRFSGARAVVPFDSAVRFLPYEREVQRGRPGFLFYRKVAPEPLVRRLERHGYRPTTVGTLVVYAPPPV